MFLVFLSLILSNHCEKEYDYIMKHGLWQNKSLPSYDFHKIKLNKAIGRSDREGHSGHGVVIEPKVYSTIAGMNPKCIKTICEIGFNAGHSALLWLTQSSSAEVIMFDIWTHKAAPIAENYLRTHVLNANTRLSIHKGDSSSTVRTFHNHFPIKTCNIISIDGAHDEAHALQDIFNMQLLADPSFHVLFIDDTNCNADYCVDSAVKLAMNAGLIKRQYGWSEGNNRGISIFKYT